MRQRMWRYRALVNAARGVRQKGHCRRGVDKRVFASMCAGRARGRRLHGREKEQVGAALYEMGENGASAEDPTVAGADQRECSPQNVTRCEEGEAAEAERGERRPDGQPQNRLDEKAETAGREEEELLWSACTVC